MLPKNRGSLGEEKLNFNYYFCHGFTMSNRAMPSHKRWLCKAYWDTGIKIWPCFSGANALHSTRLPQPFLSSYPLCKHFFAPVTSVCALLTSHTKSHTRITGLFLDHYLILSLFIIRFVFNPLFYPTYWVMFNKLCSSLTFPSQAL